MVLARLAEKPMLGKETLEFNDDRVPVPTDGISSAGEGNLISASDFTDRRARGPAPWLACAGYYLRTQFFLGGSEYAIYCRAAYTAWKETAGCK